jgi:hypothetical protein
VIVVPACRGDLEDSKQSKSRRWAQSLMEVGRKFNRVAGTLQTTSFVYRAGVTSLSGIGTESERCR